MKKVEITEIFMHFQAIYRGLWKFESDEMMLLALDYWAKSLIAFDYDEIEKAIDFCAQNLDMPPSIRKFKEICLMHRERKEKQVRDHMPRLEEPEQPRIEMPQNLKDFIKNHKINKFCETSHGSN